MTTSGTYYYPPSAGTGNLLLANSPFVFQSMDTNQPTTADGLPELTEDEFLEISDNTFTGCSGLPVRICSYEDALRIARAAYRMGADAELEACCEWLLIGGLRGSACARRLGAQDLRAFRRPKPPSLREQALAAARIELNANGKNGALIIRALEALPE